MTGERSMFETITTSSGDHFITFAGNQKGRVLGTGNINLSHLVTICCPSHNFVIRASIVCSLTRV